MFEIIGLLSTIYFIYEYINYQSMSPIDRLFRKLDKLINSDFEYYLRNIDFNWFCKCMLSCIFFIVAINSFINMIEKIQKKLR